MGAITKFFSRMVEAAGWRPEERSFVWAQAADSKFDVGSADRTRLLALSRKLFYNNSIVRAAIRDKAAFSVGPGIRPQAMTGTSWDNEAEAWWAEWSKSPEISGRHDMRSLQFLASEAIDRDGEVFFIKTRGDSGPLVQVVESHRVGTPPENRDQIVDGVRVDRFSRPKAYFVIEGDGDQRTHRAINAELCMHLFEPERADQIRGYPAIAVALNSILDRDELLRFEMQAAKLGSSIGLVIRNNTGTAGATGASGAAGFLGTLQNSTSAGDVTREQVFGGGMLPRLKAAEQLESFALNRPNEKLDAHLEQYIRAAALGLGLPYEFIWDTSALNGTAQRFIMAKASRVFAARQDVLINQFLRPLWQFAIAGAIEAGQLPRVDGWKDVTWQTPRSITVDVGREAAARREDVQAGLLSLADYFGEQGQDWKEQLNQIAAERAYSTSGQVDSKPLIETIGIGGSQALGTLIADLGAGRISAAQARALLVSVFGLSEEAAAQIAPEGSGGEAMPADPAPEPPTVEMSRPKARRKTRRG